jgi:hydroxymethylglutaryl-CoA reductase
MQIAAAAGLANNFSAIKALITHGIQAGHMPLHHRKQKDVSR